jgi:hypothetical protein
MYVRSWTWFSETIRKVTAGAALVTEILDGILADDDAAINTILVEYDNHREKLSKLIKSARKISKSMRGRIEVRRLADQYRTEANWPTDDVSLRRAYEIYKTGRLATCLPAVDKLVQRLA